jgi:hypothetical protein
MGRDNDRMPSCSSSKVFTDFDQDGDEPRATATTPLKSHAHQAVHFSWPQILRGRRTARAGDGSLTPAELDSKPNGKKRGKKRKETRTMRKDDRGVLKLTLDDPLLPLFEQWDAGGHPNVRTSGASGVALVLRRGK